MDVGRALGVLQGARKVDPRGVAGPVPPASIAVDDLSLGMSSDMRTSAGLSWSTVSRSAAPEGEGEGEVFRGVLGVFALFALSMFSKWLRRDDTGFCVGNGHYTSSHTHEIAGEGGDCLRWRSHLCCPRRVGPWRLCLCLPVSQRLGLGGRCSSTAEEPFPLSVTGLCC